MFNTGQSGEASASEPLLKALHTMTRSFFNLYSHDFARVAVAVPVCRVADPLFNAQETLQLAREAAQKGALLVVFPELGISAYTCDDLFHQRALLDACEAAIGEIVAASTSIPAVMVIGAPLKIEHKLFNCALVISNGKLCGVVPKSYLPNYGEFYEAASSVRRRTHRPPK